MRNYGSFFRVTRKKVSIPFNYSLFTLNFYLIKKGSHRLPFFAYIFSNLKSSRAKGGTKNPEAKLPIPW